MLCCCCFLAERLAAVVQRAGLTQKILGLVFFCLCCRGVDHLLVTVACMTGYGAPGLVRAPLLIRARPAPFIVKSSQ